MYDIGLTLLQMPRQTRLGKCDTCFDLDQKLRQKGIDIQVRELYKKKRQQHLNLVTDERRLYEDCRSASCKNQNGVLSLIVDGARPVGFPNLFPTPKMFSDLSRLALPIYGVKCHTFDILRLIASPPHVNHDVNFVLTTIISLLSDPYNQHGQNFPRKRIVLQMDNTTSQNKNCYVIGFLALLVHLGLFEDAEMYFLPVGHTHEVRKKEMIQESCC